MNLVGGMEKAVGDMDSADWGIGIVVNPVDTCSVVRKRFVDTNSVGKTSLESVA